MTISLMSLFASGNQPDLKRVAVYYGYPSLVNGAKGDLDKAAQVFNRYHIVVFGDGLEFPGAEHCQSRQASAGFRLCVPWTHPEACHSRDAASGAAVEGYRGRGHLPR